jgi:glycosyltransferase involved in cell wall biosynthesis
VQRRVRLAYLVSHPIQYQVPLLRRIAKEPDIDLTVLFGSDFSVRSYEDKGFGVAVKWDVPLLDGYQYEFLPVLRDNATNSVTSPISRGILRRLAGRDGHPAYDLLWVHGYNKVNSIQGMLAAKSLGIPVLLRAESWLRDRSRSTMRLKAKQAFFAGLEQLIDGVLCIGTLNRNYWQYYFGDRIPLFDMPYAVDNEFFQKKSADAAAERRELMEELNLESGRKVILFASKLLHRKHCDHLLEAYKRVVARSDAGVAPYLVIAGDGEARATLEVAAEELEGVRFCGFRNQSELPRFFDLASVFVLPSRHEAWGLIVNEVMNAGRAVIVSDDVGCHPDLITNGMEGFVYPVGDVGALTEALWEVIDTPALSERMGESARARIAEWGFEQDVAGLRQAIAALTKKISAEPVEVCISAGE